MFTAAAKECMKMSLIDAYRHKDEVQVLAPSETMEKVRNFAKKCDEAAACAREKCEDTVGGVTDKADDLAAQAKDALSGGGGLTGMIGGLAGSAIAGATAVAGGAADLAASGTGIVAEKAIQAVAAGMHKAIEALDQPFKDVGKDILGLKENEIIACYCKIIDDSVKITDAAKCVRGELPRGQKEYNECKPTACVDTMQAVCQKEILEGLRGVVQEEINKHLVTRMWDGLIENYNAANAKLKEYPALAGFVGEPFKLDINEYIIGEVASQFHGLMQRKEGEIRKAPGTEQNPKSKSMPRTFHLFFSGNPPYDEFTMEHYANYKKQ
jgi:hypothetical protein